MMIDITRTDIKSSDKVKAGENLKLRLFREAKNFRKLQPPPPNGFLGC